MMSLLAVLKTADVDDLDMLTDYITDKGEGRLMLDRDNCKRLLCCKAASHYDIYDRELIANEIQAFGGNTLVNLFRRRGVPYGELVRDVGEHLKVNFSKNAAAIDIEVAILQKIFNDALARMSDSERMQVLSELNVGELTGLGPVNVATLLAAGRLGGFETYKMAVIVANAIAKSLLGRGLSFTTNAGLARVIGITLGPIGWVLTGLWTLADLGSPAYRVTVPCVIQIAYMRQKEMAKAAGLSATAQARALTVPPEVPVTKTTSKKPLHKESPVSKRPVAKKASTKKASIKKALTKKSSTKRASSKKATNGKTHSKASTRPVAKKATSRKVTKKAPASKKSGRKSGTASKKHAKAQKQ
ncbi:hypothetical protein DWU98_04490 [Dyella monticola]|uniref:Ubiquinol-cytochrome c chaperone domain-containing protein n=1 Tax=Dyella monticola TaxID=1927958 RepID=A0A370X5D7_9GAMM|nr:ubiquinol-cytochrome C chaperone family protein [Dyella monticola]RDS83598.1 hypothetical protein DWU98_04490 [Dyella monticola]